MPTMICDSNCVVCGADLVQHRMSWIHRCEKCSYFRSTLPDKINHASTDVKREIEIEESLLDVRNFDAIEKLAGFSNSSSLEEKVLLDIGPGSGNFMARCLGRGLKTFGVEPDESLAASLVKRGFQVLQGYYPERRFDRSFDFITLNDVLEHCPNIVDLLAACRRDLKDDGVLLVTLPSSSGILFKIAFQLTSLGFSKPFKRLWQTEFASPHIHFFNPANFSQAMEQLGWRQVKCFEYPAFSRKKLWQRISADGDNHLYHLAAYVALRMALPTLSVLPKDFSAHFFVKRLDA